jgi:hypothetical protein
LRKPAGFSGDTQRNPGSLRRLAEKAMRNLCEDSHAVSHLSGGILTCAVLQFLHNVQGVIHHAVVLPSVDIDYSSDAAGIMFHLRVHFLFSYAGPCHKKRRLIDEVPFIH